ncbi:MAG: glycosyltransferase family 4 protein [Thermoanaerobaculales bacterium]
MNRNAEPRVLHVTRNLDQGGAQAVLCTLAESRPAGSEFFVCTLADGPLWPKLEAAGAQCAMVPGPRCQFSNPVRYASERRRIVRELATVVDEWRIEIVQTHLLTVLDSAVLRLRRIPHPPAVVWTFHGTDFLPLRPGPTLRLRRLVCRWLYRATARRVDAIVAVSEAVRDSVVGQLGPAAVRTRVIGNAPSPRKYEPRKRAGEVRADLGLDSSSRAVLFVGRLAEEKGCRHLVEAVPGLLSRVPGAVTLLAGHGPDRERLEALARRTGVASQVRFLGNRDDVADLLAAADVVCLPSVREGLSLSLLEAMAAGRPVVASNIAANRALLDDGITGLLVPPSDPAALARGLIAILTDPERAMEMAKAARRRALAEHSPKRQWELYSALYRDLRSASTWR